MLSENVKPSHYTLEFDVNLKTFKVLGKESIKISVKEPTAKILLHAADMKITKCSVVWAGNEMKARTKVDKKKEELVVTLPQKIVADAELRLEFEGVLNEGLNGFYRSKYVQRGRTRYLATTHLEPADCRRVFPCFDEPLFKATFDVSVVIDSKLKAIYNMPDVKTEKFKAGKKRVSFARTPLMSTYLFYIGIGDFEFNESNLGDTVISIATTPGKSKLTDFAMDCTKKFLGYYNDYFGVPYPLPKLDLIAVPDFESGAMENWGAITFRELGLLYDPKTTSTGIKHWIAEVIAHELAHMWFGDLVTMKWWDDLWLNES